MYILDAHFNAIPPYNAGVILIERQGEGKYVRYATKATNETKLLFLQA